MKGFIVKIKVKSIPSDYKVKLWWSITSRPQILVGICEWEKI